MKHKPAHSPCGQAPNLRALDAVLPETLEAIRQTLIEQESAHQGKPAKRPYSSIWAHSSRVARIAHHIARTEGWEPEPALLAGLLHDCGKFAHGSYHENETPEEERAVRIARKILMGTTYEKWLPVIVDAIVSTFLEGETTNDAGRAVYDADCLDKLGSMGVVQFFVKKALRQRFLSNELLIRASTELTYARHAPETLKTATGRDLAIARSERTRRFYTDLIEEWAEIGLGEFTILQEEIAGIDCHLVVPVACSCGERLIVDSDIQDSLKCRSAVMIYQCPACGFINEFSFCLPNVKGLPNRR